MLSSRRLPAMFITMFACLAVTGCTGHRPDEIPDRAKTVEEGEKVVSYTAPADCMIYLYDKTDNRLLYHSHLDAGKLVSADPAANRVTVDGTPVESKPLIKGHTYQILAEAPTP